tara:strand:+ start:946 stop:1158 length:213 start_codon:yes stop_codon:yes gene_type:complete
MEKVATSLIQKYVKKLPDKDLLVLFLHYQKIIDNINLCTLNDSIWFFVLKEEKIKRKLEDHQGEVKKEIK